MFWLKYLALSALVLPAWQLGPQMGPVGRLDIKKVEECPNAKSITKVQLTTDDKNRRVCNAQVNLAVDYDKKTTFKFVVDKWTGSEWKKKVMSYDGSMCDFLNKNLPDFRKRIYDSIGVSGTCDIKKGKYTIKSLYGTEKDLKMPALPYGTFRAELQLLDPKKKSLLCYIIDIDSVPK